jgi:polysaccharide biosynthesis transport protein
MKGNDVTFADLWLSWVRQWRLIVSIFLLFVTVSAVVTLLTPREYSSQTQFFVSTANSGTISEVAQGSSFTQQQVATYADLVTAPIVLSPVIDDLGLDESPQELGERISVSIPPNTVLIDVVVTDNDPAAAAQLADSVGTEFAESVQELERLADGGPSPVKVTVVEPATTAAPSSPNPPLNIALGAVLGALVGLAVAVVRDLLNTRIRAEADVGRVTQLPTVGAIPFDADAERHPLVAHDSHGPRAEAFRTVRTNVQFLNADKKPRSLVLTSTLPGEGKSTTTANLALILAEAGATVCLIEGDLRRPRLLDYLGLENAAGLTDVLVDRADLLDVLQPYRNGLSVLGCGPIPPNPSEMLGSDAMRDLLARLEKEYDFVIVDAPPLLPVTDAAVLSTLVDGTLLVVGAGLVKRDQLQRALASLEKVGGNILGLVLNRLPVSGPDSYSYSYETYRPETEEAPNRRTRRDRARQASRSTRRLPVAEQ